MQTSLVMCLWFVFGDDWNDVLCWSRFAEHDFKRLLDLWLKRVWKTYSGEILFPVGSHVVAKAKSSKASEFKFPFPWCRFRFIIIFIFLVIVFLSFFSIVKSLNPGVISFSILWCRRLTIEHKAWQGNNTREEEGWVSTEWCFSHLKFNFIKISRLISNLIVYIEVYPNNN